MTWTNPADVRSACKEHRRNCFLLACELAGMADEKGLDATTLEVEITEIADPEMPWRMVVLPLNTDTRDRLRLGAHNWYFHVTTAVNGDLFDVLTGATGEARATYLEAFFDETDILRLVEYDLADGEPSHAARRLLRYPP